MWTAEEVYGGRPAAQPTPSGRPDYQPGTPEPVHQTVATHRGMQGNPALLFVLLLGAAALLLRFDVRGSLEVSG